MSKGKRKDSKKILRTLILIIFSGVFVFSTYKVIGTWMEEKQNKQIVNDIQKKVVTEMNANNDKTEIQILPKVEDDKDDKETERKCPIAIDFDILKEECQDVVAWIYSPDTVINYPVVQGPDNQFYLRKLINGEYNTAGTLFIDSKNQKDFSDNNTIIYGHNMKNNTMFGSLSMYEQQEYYDNHPVMYLLTAEKNYKIELFSSFITPADSDIYSLPADENNFEALISDLRENSDFKSNVSIEPGDRIVTLSTCSYEYDVARRVVIGVLKEIG